jgi:hypothetical protein
MKPDNSACWGAAKRGYCSMFDALVNNYAFNATQVCSRLPPGASGWTVNLSSGKVEKRREKLFARVD